MLLEPEKLRWCGINLCSRTARRIAVALTYAVYVAAMCFYTRFTSQYVMVLWWITLCSGIGYALREAFSSFTARAIQVGGLIALIAFYTWGIPSQHGTTHDRYISQLYAAFIMTSGSVVGVGGLVEPPGRGWVAQAIKRGEAQSWWRIRHLARIGYAVGLDGFAWYEYMARYKSLTPTQQLEIQQLRAANPRGKWMRPHSTVLYDDERLRHADEHVRTVAHRLITTALILSALYFYWAETSDRTFSSQAIATWAFLLATFSLTLRQAIVLWTEPDPRTIADELQIVEPPPQA